MYRSRLEGNKPKSSCLVFNSDLGLGDGSTLLSPASEERQGFSSLAFTDAHPLSRMHRAFLCQLPSKYGVIIIIIPAMDV